MATTPNFSWPTPDNTDLVKNGALAIRTLGDAIDASLVDLEGGTTGQVLSKTSNTDMDFTWVTTDDANALQNAIVDAKGDLIAASANDTPARLAVGANDLILTAASGEATGLKYTGAWTAYTPSFTNFTLGNGTLVARYRKLGKTAEVLVRVTLGSTSSVSGTIVVTLPSGIVTNQVNIAHTSNCAIEDFGTATFAAFSTYYGTGEMYLWVGAAGGTNLSYGGTSATSPMTWTTNDAFQIQMSYEVA
jgi:hypothetical protein